MDADPPADDPGTDETTLNATQKVCAVLRALAAHAPAALRTLASEAELNKGTTFRILNSLAREGFVRRPVGSQLYDMGPEIAVLAQSLGERADLRAAARPFLLRLAAQSGDTVVLSIRSGPEAVSLDRQVGTFPIQSNYLHPGTRRPLGVGAGATAILAALPEDEAEVLIELLKGKLAPFPGLSIRAVREHVRLGRSRGYVMVLNQIVDRMGGIAVAIRPQDEVLGAISISALSERIQGRQQLMAEWLTDAARKTEQVMAQAMARAV